MKKLNWEKKYLSDKSGYWFETKVKFINWTYVIETGEFLDRYKCFLFVNNFAEETLISKKEFKTLENAQKFCEKHLDALAKNFNKFLKS